MKRFDVDKIFGLMVKDYLDKGYVINTDSMRGIQGEIAKVDLLKGKELIRVSLSKGCDYRNHYTDTLVLVVGRYTKDIVPGWTYWNDDFDDIERDVIYQIGNDWYAGNDDYIKECRAKKNARFIASYTHCDELALGRVTFPDSARKMVLNRVRRLPKCKSVKLSDIGSVWRERKNDKMVYCATVRDETRFIGEVSL